MDDPLAAALGGTAPPLTTLDGDARRQLAALVDAACAAQSTALDGAVEAGLKNIPRPLRGVVRKALFR